MDYRKPQATKIEATDLKRIVKVNANSQCGSLGCDDVWAGNLPDCDDVYHDRCLDEDNWTAGECLFGSSWKDK